MDQRPRENRKVKDVAGKAHETPSLAQQMSRVKQIIGVMSGKGGVGKSSVTAFLATALRQAGHKVAILDADITGPSIPKMLGVKARAEGGEFGLEPALTLEGIKIISLNLLLERPDDPIIWRGPLLANTVKQLWEDVVWGELDFLLVDLPPGTADIPLTVMQSIPLAGLVVVSSPQELAAMIVRKAIKMAALLEVRLLGLVENMTHLICPHCGKRVDLFGAEQGSNVAQEAGIPLLASIPVDPVISKLCDQGQLASYQPNPFLGRLEMLKNSLPNAEDVIKST